jgi:hypothetical protein
MAITKVKAGQVTSKLNATGSTIRGLDDKLAEFVSVKDFGAVGDGVTDDTVAIQAALNSGAKRVDVPVLTYLIGNITMPSGVLLSGEGGMALAANLVVSAVPTGMPVFKVKSGTTGDVVNFPHTSYHSGIERIAFDCADQTSGNGIVLDNNGGLADIRPGHYFSDVLVYHAPNYGLQVKAGNKQNHFERVFVRGGPNESDRRTVDGIRNEATDNIFFYCNVAFCSNDGFFASGGATRCDYMDSFFNGRYGAHITSNSSYFVRLISNDNGSSGVYLASANNAAFIQPTLFENCKTVSQPDFFVTGACNGVVITTPIMRGNFTAGTPTFAFGDSGNNVVVLGDGFITGSYPDGFDNVARAYWKIGNVTRQAAVRRDSLLQPRQLLTNPYFSKFSGGFPVDWAVRNSGTAAVETVDMPTGYATGVAVTSGAAASSGIQLPTVDFEIYRGSRIRISGWFKGDTTSAANDQAVQAFDGVSTAQITVPNDGTWAFRSIDRELPTTMSVLSIRMVASIAGTSGKVLKVTGLKIEFY